MTKLAIQYSPSLKFRLQGNEIVKFFSNNLALSYGREERLVHFWMVIVSLIGVGLLAINHFTFQFTTLPLYKPMFTTLPVLFILWVFIGYVHCQRWPRFGLLAATLGNLGLASLIFITVWAAIVTTPFVIIDYHLMSWDQFFGFNVTHFMEWVHRHPYLLKALDFSYYTWLEQMILTPLVLALLNKRREVNRFFIAIAVCLSVCFTIYYFFPTVAPAGVMNSPYFNQYQYDLVTRFYEIHQYLPLTMGPGIIAFPSAHVMTALLVLFAFRKIKIIFYPMLVNNIFLILGTMGLGYHYLVDVIAGFVIVIIVLTAMHYVLKDNQSLATKNS